MTNLLPQQQMKKIKRERALRATAMELIFLFFAVLLSSVFLVPSLVLSLSKEEGITSQVSLLKKFIEEREGGNVARDVRDTRFRLENLGSIVNATPTTDIVKILSEASGVNISLTSFSIQRVNVETEDTEDVDEILEATVHIEGTATNRDELIEFVKRLQRELRFTSVDLPVSNFAERNDIEFSLKLDVVTPETI